MVLVADNAPYHHKREIGSLGSISKKPLVDLMVTHEVQYIELPITSQSRLDLLDNHPEADDRGEFIQVPFVPEEQLRRAGTAAPVTATLQELKVCFVLYLQKNKPNLLTCKVENVMRREGYEILWTPPYAPELQPIELFWAAGKNHVALNHVQGQKMRKTVSDLREGWYGNGETYPVGHPLRKAPCNCKKLWATVRDVACTKFVPLCDGISGSIGSLEIDAAFVNEEVNLPIDTLVNHVSREQPEVDLLETNSEMPLLDSWI